VNMRARSAVAHMTAKCCTARIQVVKMVSQFSKKGKKRASRLFDAENMESLGYIYCRRRYGSTVDSISLT